MEYVNDEKFYYTPGQLVTIRHDIPNKPVMFVVEKVSRQIRNKETGDSENMFIGIKCR